MMNVGCELSENLRWARTLQLAEHIQRMQHGLNGVWLQVGTEHWRDSHSRQHATSNIRDAIPNGGDQGARPKPRISKRPRERALDPVLRPRVREPAVLALRRHTRLPTTLLTSASVAIELSRASFPFFLRRIQGPQGGS